MSYLVGLITISLGFVVWERLAPACRRPAARPGVPRDLGYLLLNGHVVGLVLALATAQLARAGLSLDVQSPRFGATWHPAAQLAVHLVLFDFLQWCIHILLHRVDVLWRFHKVHHQIQVMDWMGNFHFHPLEIVVYRTVLWLPAAMFAFDPAVLLASAMIGTAWGHFNHANVNVRLGPVGYLVNGPEMHLWHHAHLDETGGRPVNFAIIFSSWDWLFGTATWPAQPPMHLGFPGVEAYPEDLPGQLSQPFRDRGQPAATPVSDPM